MGLVSGNRLNRFWQKGVKPIKDAIGVLSALSTVDKSTLVAAVNELAESKFDVAKLVASTNITEPGFAMDGKTASEAFTELYSKNENQRYTNVSNQVQAYDPNILKIDAYTENGCIFVHIIIKAGTNGIARFSVLTEKHCPRFTITGSYSSLSGAPDAQKFRGAQIDTDGNGYVYLGDPLAYDEIATFVYPIRI